MIEDNLNGFKEKKIAVIQPVVLQKLFNYTDDIAFDKNVFIGTIDFQGGMINNPETGYLTRARIKNYDNQEEFRNSVKTLFIESVVGILTKKNRDYVIINPGSGTGMSDIIKPDNFKLTEDETRTEDYRIDNINYPRFIYELKDIDQTAISNIKQKYNVSYIIIPLIEYYYIHNSGWFNGQSSGCSSGHRARLHLYIIDTEINKIAFIFKNDEKKIYEFKYVFDKYELKEWHKDLNKKLKTTLTEIIP